MTKLFARLYARAAPLMEHGGAARHRPRLLDGLGGTVLDVGAGTGSNFAHFPSTVIEVTAVEPDPYLRRLAEQHAEEVPAPVRVVAGVAEQLPADDRSVDAAVVSLVLCSVDDPERAVAELHRVIRSGGDLRFLEHVRSSHRALARTQRLLDATLWPRLAGGCHTARDTLRTIEAGGFLIDHVETVQLFDRRVPLPTTPFVLGSATRSS